MTHVIVECPGCLSRLKFRADTPKRSANCPRCDELVDVQAAINQQNRPPSQPARPQTSRPGTARPAVSRPASSGPAANPVSGQRTPARVRRPAEVLDEVEEIEEIDELDADEIRAKRESLIFLAVIGLAIVFSLIAFPSAIYYLLSDHETPAIADSDSAAPQPIATQAATGSQEANPNAAKSNPEQRQPAPVPNNSSVAAAPPQNTSPPSSAAPATPAVTSPAKQPPAIAAEIPPAIKPPDSANPNVAANNAGQNLTYKWASGQKHVYTLKIVADDGSTKENTSGSCIYTVRNNGVENTDEYEGSGTGFVVSANGYIGTCAHVTAGARQIEVTIGDKTYVGKVMAEDRKLDLAIVKIDESNLPVCHFADSDKVQLAEQVRAFGFPLSSVLGTGIKVATGAVAGIVLDPDQGRQIQTDAPINPGNSGGPIVNNFGQVIGVASSKLYNNAANSVGFAVPINEMKKMMADLGLTQPGTGNQQTLNGPELAKLVTPTVAYIKVKNVSGGKLYDIAYQGTFTQTRNVDPRQMRMNPFSMIPSVDGGSGLIKVSSSGEIASDSGKGSLPYVLGPMGQFFIDPLPADGEGSWSTSHQTMLKIIKREEANPLDPVSSIRSRMLPGGGRGGFGRGGFPGFPGGSPFGQPPAEETIVEIPAIMESQYRLGNELNNRITIHKTYEFTTTDNSNQPYLRVRGKGEIVFDKTIGMPTSMDFTATLTKHDEDGTQSKLPLTITSYLKTPEDVEQERQQAIARSEELRKQKEQERNVPDADRVKSLLAEVRKAGGTLLSANALKKLSEIAIVPELQEEVMNVALNHLENSDGFVRGAAARVAVAWGTEDHKEVIRKIANDSNPLLRDARKMAMTRLIKMQVPGVLPDLIKQMGDISVRYDTKKILIAAGESVEEPILAALDDFTDSSVRRELLDILKETGTEKSIARLQELATGKEISLRFSAQRALDAIQARM